MNTVKLKNGAEVPAPLVAVLNISFMGLLEPTGNQREDMRNVLCAYDIVTLCRDPNYKKEMFKENYDHLKLLGLIGADDKVHDMVKDVILSSVEGDGLKMKFVNPIAETPKP